MLDTKRDDNPWGKGWGDYDKTIQTDEPTTNRFGNQIFEVGAGKPGYGTIRLERTKKAWAKSGLKVRKAACGDRNGQNDSNVEGTRGN